KNTGLPFVFALWIVRKDSLTEKSQQIQAFKSSLDKAKAKALTSFEQLATGNYLQGILSKKEIVSYWRQISYDLGEEHLKGLELFGSLAGLSFYP
ncbi:MAG: MqnA/MqnD/SBP family protein, partial [Thermodesulfovibrionales bacterium]